MKKIISLFILTILLSNLVIAINNPVVGVIRKSGTGEAVNDAYISVDCNSIIKTTSLYYDGPFKCVDYDVTVDITNPWPVIGMGNIDRRTEFGTACQMPDGRWLEKPYKNPYTGEWVSR